MVESDSLPNKFHIVEKKVVGYDDFIDCSEENFLKTLEELK